MESSEQAGTSISKTFCPKMLSSFWQVGLSEVMFFQITPTNSVISKI